MTIHGRAYILHKRYYKRYTVLWKYTSILIFLNIVLYIYSSVYILYKKYTILYKYLYFYSSVYFTEIIYEQHAYTFILILLYFQYNSYFQATCLYLYCTRKVYKYTYASTNLAQLMLGHSFGEHRAQHNGGDEGEAGECHGCDTKY